MKVGLIAHKLAATNFAKGNTRTMIGVDVSSYLKDKPCKFGFRRLYYSLFCLRRLGAGCYFHKAIEQFLHTEIIKCATEKNRCNLRRTIGVDLKFWVYPANQF